MQGKRTAVYCRVDKGGNSEMRRERDFQLQDIMRMTVFPDRT